MKLRTQLLLVSLLVLVLPWAGCQYVREMETALRQGQEDALLGSARAIASVLQNRPGLFSRATTQPGAPAGGGPAIYAHPLAGPVHVDGYFDDWNLDAGALEPLDDAAGARFAAGEDGRYLYLFFDVTDDSIVYAAGDDSVIAGSDRVVLGFDMPEGATRRLLFSTAAPGPILPRTLLPGASTPGGLPREQRALGNWQETSRGYNLELRVPLAMPGERVGFELVDVDVPGAPASQHERAGRLVHRLPALEGLLAEFAQPGLGLRVTDRHGWILAAAAAAAPAGIGQAGRSTESMLDRLYIFILDSRSPDEITVERKPGRASGGHVEAALAGRSGASWYRMEHEDRAVISVAEPVRAGGRTIGTVVLEQGSDRILTLTNAALTRLLNLTLLATALAAACLLSYATWLSLRIQRLRDAAESAVGRDARARRAIPGAGAKDEIGDLARSFSSMLDRLDEYTRYLRSLASKLSHELRTPLAVVRTSLENLEHLPLPDDARPLATRAMDGVQRLARIVTAMSAATRVEQSIASAERERFDLAALVRESVSGYRSAFSTRRFNVDVPVEPCPLEGVPDLVSQMLDKLIDNAVDFSAHGALIHVRLSQERGAYALCVFNAGAKLPPNMQAQLFDSLVSVRDGSAETPHLGLGLYIARLIVEFHGGSITARNLDDGPGGAAGVEFEVRLPAA